MVKGIDKLIICNPYEKPTRYYKYDSELDVYHKMTGRRPSGYQSMNENGVYGIHREIHTVNKIRKLVDEWRDAGYPDTTKTTQQLLNHWKNKKEMRLFFCQMEAIETIIYAMEHRDKVNKIIQGDDGPFSRYCTKMATGTGKTIIMGLLIAWQVLNSGPGYTKNILVVTPNLTVKDRLQVLQPGNSKNIYDEFDMMPPGIKREMLGSARITITNFQQFKPKEGNKNSVVKLGRQGAKSFAASIVGRQTKNILVINDEGHHAWRPSFYANADKKEGKEAGMWTNGLDTIHGVCKITQCCDFSATPFVPTGKSATEDTLFGWIISDFSLSDAIESGLVKTPKTPKTGDSFYRLYDEDVAKALGSTKMDRLPDKVERAYSLLGKGWEKINKLWRENRRPTPPVMITVCNNTRHAKRIADNLERNTVGLNTDLVKSESLLHIDSTTIEDDATMRDKVSTVGKNGESGDKICNIVSVDMLTEGWDARTVTHIMGLRAFKSQLLCEQVIGRGLRRTSYDVNEDGYFETEHVDILGVPFAGILSEEAEQPGGGTTVIPVDIYPDKPEHIIAWPIITEIRDTITYKTEIDWEKITPLDFDKTIPSSVSLGPLIDGWVSKDSVTFELKNRKQTVMYGILQSIMSNYRQLEKEQIIAEYSPYANNPQGLAISILYNIKEYVKKFIDVQFPDRVEQVLFDHRDDVARHIYKNLVTAEPLTEPKIEVDGTDNTDIPRRATTNQRRFAPKKTHLNLITAARDFEIRIGKMLDRDQHVRSWIKSDMVRFSIQYEHPDGTRRNYLPDFIAHLNTGVQLVIEGKGKEDDIDIAKKKALRRWVDAVNQDGKYGVWDSTTLYSDKDLQASLIYAIQASSDRQYTVVCERCGLTTKTLAESVDIFGVENNRGILKVSTLCVNCQKVIKNTSSN